MAINQNQALFALLGTFYGGNGTSTFALPDLQGRVPAHSDGSNVVLGQKQGSVNVTLTLSTMPAHTHVVRAQSTGGTTNMPAGNVPAASATPKLAYGSLTDVTLNPQVVSFNGGSQPHPNIQPTLVVLYCIAIQGIFPSRN
jgi:microcystin-dependent protein